MPVTTVIQDGLIDRITLYQPKYWLSRLDVFPFMLTYILSTFLILQDSSLKFPALIAFPIALTTHLAVFLLAQSSVAFRCLIGKTVVDDLSKAVDIHVHAAKNAGKDRLVNLIRFKPSANSASASKISVLGVDYSLSNEAFFFQEVMYCYNCEQHCFQRLDYPTTFTNASIFLGWEGLKDNEAVLKAFKRWGINEFNIPMPHFLDLYMEHLVAPFFVFQVLCLFLWSLDDYWYYSAFTLMMLMIFEGVMCNQRQNSVLMMRNMRRPPYKIFVYRAGQWVFHNTDTIFPGDIISLTAEQTIYQSDITESGMIRKKAPETNFEGKVIPCDVMLIRGTCVVNEAMLTGESVPKVKESVNQDDTENLLHVDVTKSSVWNRHLLLGGTLLQQHSGMIDPYTSSSPLLAKIPPAPDGGCIGIVIKSGFATTQGELMRKILFATEGTGGNSRETFGFIAVLVFFAVIAAAAVLQEGVLDERRNKFRLALHCIMIITSVVPPELPMELSLAVTNSLAALAKQMIYCTEPYRIPFAGKLNVICFDKTGTLTKDEMVLKGIVAGQRIDVFTGKKIISMKEKRGDDEIDEEEEDDEEETEQYQESDLIAPDSTTDFVQLINGTCHDLVERQMKLLNPSTNLTTTSNEILGDPLEIASFSTSGFKFLPNPSPKTATASRTTPTTTFAANFLLNPSLGLQATILQKYPFNSELKRMSSIVQVKTAVDPTSLLVSGNTAPSSSSSSAANLKEQYYVFTKGAPEVIQQYLSTIPEHYHDYYQQYMTSGKRVLALAYKTISPQTIRTMNRQTAEKGLSFAGFLIFDCDLKADSRSVIKDLLYAQHQVVMITGDSVFTAANVGKRIALYEKDQLPFLLTVVTTPTPTPTTSSSSEAMKLVWRRVDCSLGDAPEMHPQDISFDWDQLASLQREEKAVFCVPGPALEVLIQQSGEKILPASSEDEAGKASVTTTAATVSQVLKKLCSFITIFARVSPAQKEKIIHAYNESGHFTLMCGDGTNDVGALKAAHVGVSVINNPKLEKRVEGAAKESHKKGKLGGTTKDRLARAMLELQEHEADPTIVKLGDASIAYPFTAKRTSIDSVLTVIRQGRCTLVGTIQVYKVLALNCLSSAFMMSALYMKGLKQGDTQMTCSGVLIAALFFFVSQAKPLSSISAERPPSSVFQSSVSLSIIGQFLTHLLSMYLTVLLCESFVHEEHFSLTPDGKFTPNLFNSAMFLLSNHMQINNFWINYRGPPFMEEITENIYLWRSLQGIYLILLVVIGGQFEPLNDLLQLVSFPNQDYQVKFLLILGMNTVVNYLIERGCRRFE